MMYRWAFIAAISILFAASSVLADVADDPYYDDTEYLSIFEDFSGEVFPPPGWRILGTNKKKTWEQSNDCDFGERCAVIEGDPSGTSNERLISPQISCSKGSTFHATVAIYHYNDGAISNYTRKPFYLEVSYQNPFLTKGNWEVLDDDPTDLKEDDFWIAIRFSGDELTGRWELVEMWIEVFDDSCKSEDDPYCACGAHGSANGGHPALIMGIIGFCALILSTRKSAKVQS